MPFERPPRRISDAARPADRRARRGRRRRGSPSSRSAAGASVLWRGAAGASGTDRGIADVAAGTRWARAPSGRRSGAGCRGAGSRRPRPTPTRSGTGASGRFVPSAVAALQRGERVAVPHADHAPHDPVGRRRRRLDDARPRQVADDGAHRVLLALARELVEVQVVARRRALGRAHDLARRGLQQVLAHRRALDEEHVQALVAAGGEQQAARRAARRGPRGRPPGSRPRSTTARTRGRPSARRPCPRPSRTRWWRRRPAPRPP